VKSATRSRKRSSVTQWVRLIPALAPMARLQITVASSMIAVRPSHELRPPLRLAACGRRNLEPPCNSDTTMIRTFKATRAHGNHDRKDRLSILRMKCVHACDLVTKRAAPACGDRLVLMNKRRFKTWLGGNLQQAETDPLAEQTAVLRSIDAPFFEAEFEWRINRREHRPWIDSHSQRVGGELRYRAPTRRKAAILIQDGVGND